MELEGGRFNLRGRGVSASLLLTLDCSARCWRRQFAYSPSAVGTPTGFSGIGLKDVDVGFRELSLPLIIHTSKYITIFPGCIHQQKGEWLFVGEVIRTGSSRSACFANFGSCRRLEILAFTWQLGVQTEPPRPQAASDIESGREKREICANHEPCEWAVLLCRRLLLLLCF